MNSPYNKRCTGTGCAWSNKCAVSLGPHEYLEQIIVPLREYTAEWCDMYEKKEELEGQDCD